MEQQSLLVSSLVDELNEQWKNILDVNAPREMEFRIRDGHRKVSYIDEASFRRVVQYCKDLSRDNLLNTTQSICLDILKPSGNFKNDRLSLSNEDDLNNFCKNNNFNDVRDISVITKDKSSGVNDHTPWHYRYQISTETPHERGSETYLQMIKFAESNELKQFCYKKRMSVIDGNIRYDLTVLRDGKYRSFSEMLSKTPHEKFQVELEYIGDFPEEPDRNVLVEMASKLNNVLCIYRDTSLILSVDMDREIIASYLDTAFPSGAKPNPEDPKQRRRSFIGCDVSGLEHHHLKKSNDDDSESIFNRKYDYMVTPKADGVRRMLYIDEEGDVHLLSNKMELYHVGYKLSAAKNYILDGELVVDGSRWDYYVFDCFFAGQQDMRPRPLFLPVKDEPMGKEKSRLNAVNNVVKMFQDAQKLPGVNNNFSISCKPYLSIWNGDTPNLSVCKDLMEMKHPYNIDGLIFTPNHLFIESDGHKEVGYPVITSETNWCSWAKLLKWKPVDQLSIDFVVQLTDRIEIIYRNDRPIPHRVANLLVSKGKILQVFDPHLGDVKNVGRAYLEIHEGNRFKALDGDQILDGNVVEFIYQQSQWTPIRVRHDKLRPNGALTARSNWKMIISPIKKEVIYGERTPDTPYYEDISNNDTSLVASMRSFHNEVKSRLLIAGLTILSERRRFNVKLMDMGTGRAGDLHKWKSIVRRDDRIMRDFNRNQRHRDNPITVVLGIDKNKENLEGSADNARSRYERMGYNNLTANFIAADATMPLRSDNDELPKDTRVELTNYAPAFFDLMTCFFTLHYFCDKETSLKGFFENAQYYLRKGGVLLIADLDGETIHKSLRQKNGVVKGTKNNKDIWEIRRGYTQRELENAGQMINVYNISISRDPIPEYLVNFAFLEQVANQFGFKKYNGELPRHVDLRANGDGFFSEVESSHKMSKDERNYSNMHRYIIFRKQ